MICVTQSFDDEAEAARALKWGELHSALFRIAEVCRSRLKHGEGVSELERATLEDIRSVPGWVLE